MNTNRMANSTLLSRLPERLIDSVRRTTFAPDKAHHPTLLDSVQATGGSIKRILVPLDGTAFSEHALPLALTIAQQCDAVLQLVHVVVPADGLSPFDILQLRDDAIQEHKKHKLLYLSQIAHRISRSAAVGVSSAVINGLEVADALDGAYGGNADLVVMATHGRGLLGRFWWGSVAHSLLQRASVPVLLVPGSDEKAKYTPQSIDNVILPIDDDKRSARVAEPLLRLGAFAGARHTLLHVARPVLKLTPQGERLRGTWVASRSREAAGREYLRRLADSMRNCNREVRTKVVSSQEPVWQVLSWQANQYERPLVVCSYRPTRLLRRLVRPGTSEHLFRALNCPLMLVPN